ncbi:Ig-like domain-containing protein, partial [Candidatus Uhrbacteria bacterium]|nr:Ig-like domain-containing protein [Candidatus Uhrbacteria bacterium]
FTEGILLDFTQATAGTAYTSSNPAVASVSIDGLVTATASGVVLISATNDGALGVIRLRVVLSGDSDGDGIPDDVELSSGLDPNNAVDGFEDTDGDGLTNFEELTVVGSSITSVDTDGDGISDGEEVVAGADGFVTSALLADTDGDGVRDALEIATGSDPADPSSLNLAAALQSISVTPAAFSLTVNALFGEVFEQLVVVGSLLDGTTLDITSSTRGTSYSTSNASVCNFGAEDGRIFAGSDGSCLVSVDTNGFSAAVPGSVASFTPQQIGRLDLPFFGNDLDVDGDYLFVAAATAGLAVIDVSDKTQPTLVATLGLPGNGNDVKVRGGIAYLAAHDAGLHLIDVSTPTSPTLLNTVDTPGLATDLSLNGDYAFVADGEEGLQVIDIASAGSASIVASLSTEPANGLATDGRTLVISTRFGNGGLATIVDVSEPTAPVDVASVFLGARSFDVELVGTFAYIATALDLAVVDVSEPSTPQFLGRFGTGIFMTDVIAATEDLL